MSHYAVLVIKNQDADLEAMLEPYSENLAVEPHIDRTKQEMIEEAKAYKEKLLERIKEKPDTEISDYQRRFLDAETDQQFYDAEYDNCRDYDEDGNELTTYNPKSKWDWWVVGGRWSGSLLTKEGEEVDGGLVKELNLDINKERYDRSLRWYEVAVEGAPLRDGESKDDFFTIYNPDYLRESYKTKENYAKIHSLPIFFAVVTPDGEWHEKGEMGWFGMSSETAEESLDWDLHFMERFIDNLDDNMELVVVDCHI